MISVASLALAAVSLVLLLRSPVPGDQRQLLLRDEDGHVRIRLVAERAGARIELLDDDGQARLSLSREASSTSLKLNRATTNAKGIELLVPDRADSGASQASVTIYSQDAKHVATIAAAMDAWLSLKSGQGNVQLTQAGSRSELTLVNTTNWATLEVREETGAFSTEKPLVVDLYGGHQLSDGHAVLPVRGTKE